jgi:hypothetical protein
MSLLKRIQPKTAQELEAELATRFAASPEEVKEIQELRSRLEAIDVALHVTDLELAAIHNSSLWQLYVESKTWHARGQDLLSILAEQARQEIQAQRDAIEKGR